MKGVVLGSGLGGFLGSHVREALEAAGYGAEALPRELRRSPAELRARLAASRPAALVHLAGVVDVRYCREHPLEAFEAHVRDTAILLEAARAVCPEAPFLYVATDKSFGEQEDCGLSTPYRPGFPYESSKACEDLLVETYRTTYSLPVCLLRFPNFFGEGDRHDERLIPGVCLAARHGTELVIRTRLDGSVRQYIYVADAAAIVRQALDDIRAGRAVWPKNHFGPPHVKTAGDVVRDVEAVSGRKVRVRELNQPGEVSRLTLRDENGFGARYTDWMPALERTWKWYRGPG